MNHFCVKLTNEHIFVQACVVQHVMCKTIQEFMFGCAVDLGKVSFANGVGTSVWKGLTDDQLVDHIDLQPVDLHAFTAGKNLNSPNTCWIIVHAETVHLPSSRG